MEAKDYVFTWDDNGSGTTETTPTVEETVEKVLNDTVSEEQKPKTEEEKFKEEADNYVFKFGDDDEDEVEETTKIDNEDSVDKKTKSKEVPSKISSKTTLEFLKNKGYIDFELEEGEELSDELADEKLEDAFESAVISEAEEMINDLPDELKDIIRYVNKGGDFKDLVKKLAESSKLSADTDMTLEANQISVVRNDLLKQGYDDEYIDSHIEILKDTNKLSTIAKKLFDKDVEKDKELTAKEAERQAKLVEENKKKQRQFVNTLNTTLSKTTNLNGLKITKEDKKDLVSYISDSAIQLEDGRIITELQKDIFSIHGNPEKLLLLAKVIKSDFNFDDLKTKGKEEYIKNSNETIQNTNQGGSQKSVRQRKSLADLID